MACSLQASEAGANVPKWNTIGTSRSRLEYEWNCRGGDATQRHSTPRRNCLPQAQFVESTHDHSGQWVVQGEGNATVLRDTTNPFDDESADQHPFGKREHARV